MAVVIWTSRSGGRSALGLLPEALLPRPTPHATVGKTVHEGRVQDLGRVFTRGRRREPQQQRAPAQQSAGQGRLQSDALAGPSERQGSPFCFQTPATSVPRAF